MQIIEEKSKAEWEIEILEDNGLDDVIFEDDGNGMVDKKKELTNLIFSCLVEDSKSVCLPCSDIHENETEPTDHSPIDRCRKDNNGTYESIKHKGNAIINTCQLKEKMMKNLLCSQCVQEQLNQNILTRNVNLGDAVFDVDVTKVAFACIITVQCKHGHSFCVEPARVPIKEETNQNDNTEKEQEQNSSSETNNNDNGPYEKRDDVLDSHGVPIISKKRKG